MRDSNSISVVIPVFNGGRYLRDAVESVLAQTRPPEEIIVVDDGSTDGSGEIARAFAPRVCCKRTENGGISAARNHGIAHTTGGWLAFLDADDLWQPDKLARQMTAAGKNPAMELIFCGTEQFISPDLSPVQSAALAAHITRSLAPMCGSMLARREIFQRVGLFNPAFRVGEFIDWYARARDTGAAMMTLSDVLLRRRLHLTNTTRRQRADYDQLPLILKQSLDRRRANAT